MKTPNNNYLVFEFCGGGDLKSYQKEQPNQRFDEFTVQRFMRQIANGLSFILKIGIFHRDLKLQNILLSEKSHDAILKLADFGLAKNNAN